MQFLDVDRSADARCQPVGRAAIMRMAKLVAGAGIRLPVPGKLPEECNAQWGFSLGKRRLQRQGDAESDAAWTTHRAAGGRTLVAVERVHHLIATKTAVIASKLRAELKERLSAAYGDRGARGPWQGVHEAQGSASGTTTDF
jgi:hypothetical protein